MKLVPALIAMVLSFPTWALPERTWVISIGHNEGDPDETSLLYAERDSREVLEAFHVYGRVPTSRGRAVLGEDPTAIRKLLLEVNSEIRSHLAEGPTALVVFYSGHADADSLHLGGSDLPLDELKALVQGSPAGVRLLIVDSCRSGALTRVKGVAPAPTFQLELGQNEGTEGFAILTSSAAGESSQESDRLRGSFFTHHLVNALRGAADTNDDGVITLGEAYAYTYAQTLRSSGSTAALQHPTYAYDVKGRAELVLSTLKSTSARLGHVRLIERALYVVREREADGLIVAEVAPSADNAELVLPAGRYFVQQRKPTEFREFDVEVGAAQTVELKSMPSRRVQYDRLVRQRGSERIFTHSVLALAGARGPAISGSRTGVQAQLGYAIDFAWATIGTRLRFTSSSGVAGDGFLPRHDTELGAAVVLSRSLDLPIVTVGFGVAVEAVWFRQAFAPGREAATRDAAGASFAGVLSAETHIGKGFCVRIETGPQASLFPLVKVSNGIASTPSVGSAVSWFVQGGIVWRH